MTDSELKIFRGCVGYLEDGESGPRMLVNN